LKILTRKIYKNNSLHFIAWVISIGMAHFYDCSQDYPLFEKEVTTPTQARKKSSKVYPSVTTILSIVKDDFIDSIYRPSKLVELAREFPNLFWRDIETLVYGTREQPVTGDTIGSAEFGTAVHKCIENKVLELMGEGAAGDDPYDEWAEPFIDWIDESGTKPFACEYLISSDTIKTAGSVDFLGYDEDDKLFLADYKCRTNTKGRAKVYPKDCEQLAIESYMMMKATNLSYLPKCISVIIDCDTKKHYHKEWSKEDMKKGIANFKYTAKLYWNKRMKK